MMLLEDENADSGLDDQRYVLSLITPGRLLTTPQQLQVDGVAHGEHPGLPLPPRPHLPAVALDDILACLPPPLVRNSKSARG